MKSKLESARQQIKANHPNTKEDKIKNTVFEALENLSSILDEFNSEQIEQIFQIEKINPSYFPGLSKAASQTIVDLRQGNPNLSLDFILSTAYTLANRGRPWESLSAFSTFGKHCRSELSQQNIEYLMSVNTNVLEIVGSTIRNQMSDEERSLKGKFHNALSFFQGYTPMQYNESLVKSINDKLEHYFGSTSDLREHKKMTS